MPTDPEAEALHELLETGEVRAFCPACEYPLTTLDVFQEKTCQNCRKVLDFGRVAWERTDLLPKC